MAIVYFVMYSKEQSLLFFLNSAFVSTRKHGKCALCDLMQNNFIISFLLLVHHFTSIILSDVMNWNEIKKWLLPAERKWDWWRRRNGKNGIKIRIWVKRILYITRHSVDSTFNIKECFSSAINVDVYISIYSHMKNKK